MKRSMKCYDLVGLEEQESKKMKIVLAEPNEDILGLKNSFSFTSLADPQHPTQFDAQESLQDNLHYYDSEFEADIEKFLSSSLKIPSSPSIMIDGNGSQKRRVVRLLHGRATKSDSQKIFKNSLALVP